MDTPPAKGPLPIVALVVAIVTAVIHIALDLFYRPWAWANAIFDLGFADSFTNLTSVIGLSAVMVLVERRRLWIDPWQSWLVVISPVGAMLAYEFLQPVLRVGTFSTADMMYTLLGGVALIPIKRRIYDPAISRPIDGPR